MSPEEELKKGKVDARSIAKKAKYDEQQPEQPNTQQLVDEYNAVQAAKALREEQKQKDSLVDAQMAQDALPMAAKELSKDRKISQAQKEDIVIKASSPKNLLDTTKELNHTADSTPKESSSIADGFKEALTYFAPNLLGGLIGAAFEGEEGFVAGSTQGGKLRDSYIGYKQSNEELRLKQETLKAAKLKASQPAAPKLQQSQQYMTPDGKVVFADLNRGKLIDQEGRDRPDAINQVQGRYLGNLDLRGKQLNLSENKFGFEQVKGEQLSQKDKDTLSGIAVGQSSINRIRDLYKDAKTGPLIGRVQSMAQLADSSPEVFNKIKAEVGAARLAYQKATSGLQVNQKEMELISNIIPNVNDGPKLFKDKLDVFSEILASHKEAFLEATRTGQPLKASTVKAIREAVNKVGGKESSTKSGFKNKTSGNIIPGTNTSMSDIDAEIARRKKSKGGL